MSEIEEVTVDTTQDLVQDTPETFEGNAPDSMQEQAPQAPVEGEWGFEDWHNPTFKDVEAQAMAHADLHSKLGGFSGAPEEYEFNLPEGITMDTESENHQALLDFGKAVGMDNETMNTLMDFHTAEMSRGAITVESETAKLGDNAPERIQALENNIKGMGLSEETRVALDAGSATAEGFLAIEAMIKEINAEPLYYEDTSPVAADSLSEVREAMKDPRYDTDEAYRQGIERRFQTLFPG